MKKKEEKSLKTMASSEFSGISPSDLSAFQSDLQKLTRELTILVQRRAEEASMESFRVKPSALFNCVSPLQQEINTNRSKLEAVLNRYIKLRNDGDLQEDLIEDVEKGMKKFKLAISNLSNRHIQGTLEQLNKTIDLTFTLPESLENS